MQPGILLGVAVGAVGLLLTSTTAVAIAIFCVSFGFLTYLTLRRLVTGSDTAASSRPVAGPKADPGNTELSKPVLRSFTDVNCMKESKFVHSSFNLHRSRIA